MSIEALWHPWRVLRTQHSDVDVSCRCRLPDRIMGLQRGRRIWINWILTQVERRCTLTHELVHLERGPVPAEPRARAREEKTVSELAARRLIPIAALIDAYRWCPAGVPAELADELWVDIPTLRTRMASLDPFEVAELEHHLNGDWQWIA